MPDGSDRVAVSTYVPAAQRDAWREDAESLDMSQSEFVRSMVQAGRRSFSLAVDGVDSEEADDAGSDPGGNDLKTVVLDLLRSEGRLGWSEMVDALTDDLEEDLEAALTELQDENRIRHSPREGGYGLLEARDGE